MNNDTIVKTIPDDIEVIDTEIVINEVPPMEIMTIEQIKELPDSKTKKGYFFIKRVMDIVLSLIGLVVLLPVFVVVTALIKFEDLKKPKSARGSVFFSHRRWGYKGRQITIHKFRSMVCNAEEMKALFTPEQKKEFEETYKLKDDPRITKVGKFLRKTSLDELPQLWDILRGDLSIVGPRPIVKDELKKYGNQKEKFLSVKPGLTGYWQVSGRSDITYDERVNLELYYIDNKSLSLDFKIILKSVEVVLAGRGAK